MYNFPNGETQKVNYQITSQCQDNKGSLVVITLFLFLSNRICVKDIFWNLHTTPHTLSPNRCTTPWVLQKLSWKISDLVQFPQHTEGDPEAWGEKVSILRPSGLSCRSPLWKAHHVPRPGCELFYRPHVV